MCLLKNKGLAQSMKNMVSIALTAEAPELFEKAQQLAQSLNLPFKPRVDASDTYTLLLRDTGLCLQHNHARLNPLSIDFLAGKHRHRLQFGGGRGQAIARAVGLRAHYFPSIIDATAGLAQDSFVLASLGCHVQLLERSPILAALIADALDRARPELPFCEHMKLSCVNAISYLETLQASDYPDVIYLDPMFPGRQKSALVKKEMRICRDLVGDDLDAPTLLTIALQRACKRVVVKRPRLADTINDIKPHHQLIGKSCRFDIYIKAPL